MNDLNELELQLRSWVPRRPSARLKRRLFRRPVPNEAPEPSFRLSWLPPATAALLLLCVLFNQHSSQALSSAGSNSIVAIALSNQSVATYLPGSFPREHNPLPTGTFEWTNGSGSASGIGSHSVSSGSN
jgi:hypothetical protein